MLRNRLCRALTYSGLTNLLWQGMPLMLAGQKENTVGWFYVNPIIEIFVLKLHADLPNSLNTVTAYGTDYLEINQQKYLHSVIFMPEGEIISWPVENFEQLNENHFSMMAQLHPELVIFGSGLQHRFPRAAWLKPLLQLGVGLETMDTQAACRTYNILMAEGRKVLAALLLNPLNS